MPRTLNGDDLRTQDPFTECSNATGSGCEPGPVSRLVLTPQGVRETQTPQSTIDLERTSRGGHVGDGEGEVSGAPRPGSARLALLAVRPVTGDGQTALDAVRTPVNPRGEPALDRSLRGAGPTVVNRSGVGSRNLGPSAAPDRSPIHLDGDGGRTALVLDRPYRCHLEHVGVLPWVLGLHSDRPGAALGEIT